MSPHDADSPGHLLGFRRRQRIRVLVRLVGLQLQRPLVLGSGLVETSELGQRGA